MNKREREREREMTEWYLTTIERHSYDTEDHDCHGHDHNETRYGFDALQECVDGDTKCYVPLDHSQGTHHPQDSKTLQGTQA